MDNRGTLTVAENAVLLILRHGPCATSGHTEWTHDDDGNTRYRLVDLAVCRRLAQEGWVAIDQAGWATITDAGWEKIES